MSESRSRLRPWLYVLLGVAVTLLMVGGVAVFLVGRAVVEIGKALETDTRVGVRPRTADGRLELDLTFGNEATGLTSVTVTDPAGETLWELTTQGQEKPAKVVYGQVPADGPFKQTVPRDGSPPPDLRGRTVQVRVVNRYQVAFGPGQEVTDLTVEVPK